MKISKLISSLLEAIGLVRPVALPAAPLFEEENEQDEILAFQKHRERASVNLIALCCDQHHADSVNDETF